MDGVGPSGHVSRDRSRQNNPPRGAVALLLLLALQGWPGSADAATPDPGQASVGDSEADACRLAQDCPTRSCQVARCVAQRCVHSPGEDALACESDARAGLCRAGVCQTRYRRTRALCVVADFADATLEGHKGAGFRSLADVRAMLDRMERHWWWLSQGTIRMEWEILRVRLDQPLTRDAFSSWSEFRTAVVEKVEEQVDVHDYDADGDGLLDTMWIVASTHGQAPHYVAGGASLHLRSRVFVDSQSSRSVVVGAYGNFNHEVGHNLGLPDLYGPFGTLGYLSLMHDSWAQPANGFCAFDRMLLGWLTPKRVAATTRGLELAPAEEDFAAALIPISRVEYFLVEYRRRPQSGYGSATWARFDGLSILHVFELSAQTQDPPLLKVEPADGSIAPDSSPMPEDLWTPERARGPFVARSYLGGGEQFRIENLTRVGGRLRFDVVMPSSPPPTVNLLANGSFESGEGGTPDSWKPAGPEEGGALGWEQALGWHGRRSVRVGAAGPNVRWTQRVEGLAVGGRYLLCGWMRGEGRAKVYASLSAGRVRSSSPDGAAWQERCVPFTARSTRVEVACGLGVIPRGVTGAAWCDGMTLAPIERAFRRPPRPVVERAVPGTGRANP